MFGKMKDQYDFVKQAREIQKKLKKQTVEAEKGQVKVIMNGEMKVQDINIDADSIDDVSQLENDLKSALDSAVSKAQKIAAEMMKGSGGSGMPF